jgi:hypothetical protein
MTTEIQIFQLFVRPSLDVPWFQDTLPEAHYDYIRTTYAGKVKGVIEESTDGLMLTISFTFTDAYSQLEFVNDSYLQGRLAERDAYNLEHGILQFS